MAGFTGEEPLARLLNQFADGARAAPGSAPASHACPYRELSYLLVEDSETMRLWLRNTIVNAGGVRVDVSDSYNDALYRIRNRGNYEVVLCDYILKIALERKYQTAELPPLDDVLERSAHNYMEKRLEKK